MNGLSNNSEDVVECPLCMEPLEVDDLNFFPCTCGYQICRFCWHRIRTDENELCPACRKEYPENPADFTPLSQEEILALKSQKRQRDQQRKQKMTENRKHLSNVRVVQKNLVFVVGLPPRLADAEVLKKHEYFGKYGKIHKVVINPSTTYAGVQGPSASAYVTYVNNNDALRAIQSVNNVMIDGRLIKTSLGTTKYCSHFMKNQQCPKSDCMYLHELGDPEASFTKEEMHQGKHQEYEKRLHDALIAILGASSAAGIDTHSNGSISVLSESIPTSSTNNENYSAVIYTQPKEAWPSLSVSPEINKETVEDSGSASGKNKKEKPRNEKSRFEKHTKLKTNKNVANVVGSSITPNTINRENNFSTVKDRYDENSSGHTNEIHNNKSNTNFSNAKVKTEKGKDKPITNVKNKDYLYNTQNINKKYATSLDEEVKEIKRIDKQDGDNKTVQDNNTATNVKNNKTTNSDERSISSSSITSTNSTGNNSDTLSYEDYASGKTSPSALENISGAVKLENIHSDNGVKSEVTEEVLRREIITNCTPVDHTESVVTENSDVKLGESFQEDISNYCQHESKLSKDKNCNSLYNVKAAAPQLSLFDDTSFFSSAATFHQSMFVKNKLDSRQSETANVTPHLPDLLKDWEKSCKNKLAEDELSKQEELCQLHELQKRSNLCSINLPQLNITRNEFLGSPNHFNNAELNKLPQSFMTQPQQQSYQQSNHVSDQLFDTNMLKFFDFHKNQQQQIHQQYLINGQMSEIGNGALSDHLCMLSLLENGRNGPQFSDKHTGVSSPQQQQPIQKHRDVNKPDSLLALQQQYTQNRQSQPNYMQSQFSQNFADDDLGFDPFIETQKGLAELMENEMMQQRNIKPDHGTSSVLPKLQHHQPHQHVMENVQRARLPPPGFNHVNAFGFGMPNAQNTHKVAPFMNGASNTSFQQNLQLPHLWNVAPSFNQQQHNVDEQLHQINQSQILNKDRDWTAMDPAILSFRQCSSYPQQTPMQSQQHELFMQHLKQQQQNTQGLGLQLHGNSNLLHNIHNSQISSQAPVNANVQGMLEYLKTRQFV